MSLRLNSAARISGACVLVLFPALVPAGTTVRAASAQQPPTTVGSASNGPHDFDFLIGSWAVHNRRLVRRLAGSDNWVDFDGTLVVRSVWGGRANVDEYQAAAPGGPIQGMTVRLYNPQSRQWSLYWSNALTGVFDKPMIGGFSDGRGEFFDQEDFGGRAVYARFVWSGITANACRWEQALSADGGRTWETNWIMTFTREPR